MALRFSNDDTLATYLKLVEKFRVCALFAFKVIRKSLKGSTWPVNCKSSRSVFTYNWVCKVSVVNQPLFNAISRMSR
ncbi:hypothetical protein D3C85_1235720 [compost metagenome]